MPLITDAGTHDVTVKAVAIDVPTDGKAPSVVLTFATEDGREITSWNYLTQTKRPGQERSAFEITLKTLREVFAFDGDFGEIEVQTIGKECTIVTEVEHYNGKDRLKVKWINRRGGAVAVTPPPANFLASLSAAAKRVPVPANMPKPAPRPAPKAQPDDDNVPF